MTFSRRARTKQLCRVSRVAIQVNVSTYYARGKDKPSSFMTSAMQMVADRETPTRQCTSVAPASNFPASVSR